MAEAGLRFVSGRGESEEKTIDWKIEDVAEFLALSNDEFGENGVTFQAGYCTLNDGTRARANWKYSFNHTKEDEEDWVGGYLYLQNEPLSRIKSVKASHCVSLSSGFDPISTMTLSDSERKDGDDFATDENGWGCEKLITKAELLEKTKATNTLEVSLHVKVFSSHRFKPVLLETPTSSSSSEVMQMRGQANSDFLKMLKSGDGADVEIRVPKKAGGEVDDSSYAKKVHKGVLMARSSVFSKMFGKDSTMVEAETGVVVIKDMSPKGLEVFLNYLYSGEVSDGWLKVPEQILNAAEKYDLGRLKQYCGQNLMSAVKTSNAWELYQLAKLYNLSFARSGIAEFISRNTRAFLDDDESEETEEKQGEEARVDEK